MEVGPVLQGRYSLVHYSKNCDGNRKAAWGGKNELAIYDAEGIDLRKGRIVAGKEKPGQASHFGKRERRSDGKM